MRTIATLTMIFALILTSCDETKRVIDVAGSVQLTGNYSVTAIDGKKLTAETPPTFSLSALDNSFRGTTGCNSVFGNYTIDLYAINFGDLAVSERFCAEKEIMKTERDFLDALNNSGSYALENNVLTLYSKTDRSVVLKATKETKN